ncbi:sorting nexin-19-like [Corythoichthys intestinalis]|uniref:sorting nexin-19-like n=1 Tax=Corythoichthys intestinalis TaxID=161448 RepID=UPI0025A55D77|nr:sorting nexin-19-like [Corythoichthys intestinalis]XP_057694551.1 sorting nexin-19-like [Corythoichthys intestinalis]XP_057694553.1 sorting nexin-19-like [Corythoichthys intestinalis]XP_057694554.1 sorting nexin-19-like [Corythoichthys intestinalis]
MAEVLGQWCLFGLGVLLAWLVLFHLLVNIWLLCVFTSLLVVLGGWLGSQAILESNSVIHLERFITLGQISSSMKDEHDLDQEIHNSVRKIIRDFVSSWYSAVSSESGFEKEVQEAMISMGMELKMRAKQLDRKKLTQRILEMFGCHLQDYLRAKELVAQQQMSPTTKGNNERGKLWLAYSRVTTPHCVMTSETVEVNYTRSLVDLLLHVLVPAPHLETDTGRFVVRELITCNVLLPLFDKISDPDWLNLFLIDIIDSSNKADELSGEDILDLSLPLPRAELDFSLAQETTFKHQNNADAPHPTAQIERDNYVEMVTPQHSTQDVEHSEVDCQQNNIEEETLKNSVRGITSNPFYQENDSDLDSPLADNRGSSVDSLVMIGQEDDLYDQQKEFGTESSNGNDLEGLCPDQLDAFCPRVLVHSETYEPTNGSLERTTRNIPIRSQQNLESDVSFSSTNQARGLPLVVEPIGNANDLTVMSPLHGSSPLPSFSFEPLSSPDGPIIIQNLRITGTITAKEHRGTGSHPYTLYTIKYETAMSCENPGRIHPNSEDGDTLHSGFESPSSVQPVAYHMVNRRYSEFLNLQARVEERTELKKLIKGVKGPKKIFPDMPFGNMDSEKIEARKGMLETFLKHLCAIPEIANSEQMQEFLALNTDARIAFVKKPFIVSRIDKIVVNAIVDTLKTAFPRSEPQSPTEENEGEVDGGKPITDKKSKSRLKFSSKNIPFLNGSDIEQPVLFSLEQTHTMFNGMSLEDLQNFIYKQENLSITLTPNCAEGPTMTQYGHCQQDCTIGKESQGNAGTGAAEMELADVALNILCLLMREQWSWLCTENIQRTIRLLFGTLINRWLDVSVANLTSTRYWVHYLQVIQESVWPGGVLPASPQTERSRQQKDNTKKQALYCLMSLLPDLITDLLNSDKYKFSWQTVLDSFQDPNINRHLVYCICDLLLEFLVPELPEKSFQRSLLQSLSKNPEKLLA